MSKFDLTAKNCQFLDRHLTFPLLEFLCAKNVSVLRHLKHILVFLIKFKIIF